MPTQNNALDAAAIWRSVREKNTNRKQTKARKAEVKMTRPRRIDLSVKIEELVHQLEVVKGQEVRDTRHVVGYAVIR